MRIARNLGVLAVGLGWVILLVSPRRRGAVARKVADARRFVSRRILDEDARARSHALDAWEDEGGAMRAPAER